MHCPNCATEAASNQKYCRSCGFSLEKFSQLFMEKSLASESAEVAPEQSDEIQKRRSKVERLRNILIGAFATGFLGIALGYGATYRTMIVEGQIMLGALIWLMILGAIAIIWLSISAEKLRQPPAQDKLKQSKEAPENLPGAQTTSKLQLDAYREPILSVTEDTTRSLEAVLPIEKKRSDKSVR